MMPPDAKRTRPRPAAARTRPAPTPAPEPTTPPDEAPFYCPGCGRRWKFPTECRGQSESAPHAPIEVVSTDELSGDPEDHTPAPASE